MNITLIGMPGSGKSFVGERLASALGFSFVDPDKLLEASQGKPLQEVLNSLGEEAFLKAEAELSAASLAGADGVVLATGGSIVYSEEAMEELARLSTIVYLEASLEALEQRIGEAPRGIIGLANKTFAQLFQERTPLYERWASITVDGAQAPEEVVSDMVTALGEA